MQVFSGLYTTALNWTTLHAAHPVLVALHLSWLLSQAPDIAGYFLLTLVQMAVIICVLRPLENVWPVERWERRTSTSIDFR